MDLQFHIHNQILGRIDHNKVVANTNRYHFIVAKFTDDWTDAAIDCIGYLSSGEPIAFNVDDTRDSVWVVPPELIQPPDFTFSFVGIKVDNTRITTNKVTIEVGESGYIAGDMPEDTYPTKYEALMSEIESVKETAEDVLEQAQAVIAGDVIDDTRSDKHKTYSSNKIENMISDVLRRILTDTTENWNAQPSLKSEKNTLYVYSDYKEVDGKLIPGIKVGDGDTYVIDLPFATDFLLSGQVTDEEKEFWNNKVSCGLDPNNPSNLIFTTN